MRLRRCLFLCTLVLVMPLVGLAQEAAAVREDEKADAGSDAKTPAVDEKGAVADKVEKVEAAPVPTPLELARKKGDAAYSSAYHDVYHILSEPNPCSSFFGGTAVAVEVLNNLFSELQTTRLSDAKTGLAMSGRTRRVMNARTGANYRLFEKSVINTGGPFYQRKFSRSDPLVPNVGSFEPNTREARAAIVLHELGHLLQGADGHWLLPNDGANDEQSMKNTTTIESRCGEQIKELRSKAAAGVKAPATTKESGPKSSQ